MSTTITTPRLVVETHRRAMPRYVVPLAVLGALVVLQLVTSSVESFPSSLYLHLGDLVDDVQGWVSDNNDDHWLFTFFLDPLREVLDWALTSLEDLLLWLPWFTLPVLAFVVVARTGRWATAAVAGLAMLFPGLVGLWEPTMATLALMTVSVALCALIGVPLGVWMARSRLARTLMGPVLDAMQTMPTTAYLLPAILLLSIGVVPAVVATVIYALPPIVRLTDLGIRQVPPATVEAAQIFGSTKRQTLLKVQLPQAVPSIVTGLNQTINMALGIVVIAALVGAGGLGQEAIDTLRLRAPGRGFVVGAALVALAIVLDRVCRSFIERPGETGPVPWRRYGAVGLGIVVAVVVGRAACWIGYPVSWETSFADPVDDAIEWVRDNTRWLTSDVNDFIVRELYIAPRDFLTDTLSWPVLVALPAVLGWWIGGRRLALFCGLAVFGVGVLGWWDETIDTLVQVVLAVVIAAAIAIPIGVWAGRRPKVEAILGPFLDALQTIPPLTYAIPFVMIFAVGMVPGLLAAVLYAIAPGIRLTALGIRGVPEATVEAATTFGASRRDLLWDVRLPLALPSIMVAVNQIILMVVAMVIISGLTGSGALGFRSVEAFTRGELGKGVEVALALTLMAMVLDRLTQGLADRFRPPAS